jgi:hypothetical protein
MSSIVAYEVMIYKDGHWTIAFVTDSKEEALSEAKNAEAGKHAQAVKVVEETVDEETGDERSKTVYTGGVPEGGAAGPGARKHSPRKAAAKKDGVKAGSVKKELHPEVVTSLIDRLRMSVLVFGAVGLAIVVLMFLYISNPQAISGMLDGLFK